MEVIEVAGFTPVVKRNVIILLGGPGAGKGTQAAEIGHWLKIPHISTGQLLRAEVAAESPLGLKAQKIIAAGGLVPDELVNDMVRLRIRKEDCKSGFILDGYPRNVSQAVALDAALPIRDRQIVIEILTDLEKMIARLTNRRTCTACGAIFHLIASPPKYAGRCDSCGQALMQRADDHEDVIRERFKAYQDVTERLTSLYQRMHVYHRVDGMRSREEVGRDIRRLLEHEIFESPSAAKVAAA